MAERFSYAILGRGAWALKIRSILEAEQRPVRFLADTRRNASESDEAYTGRLASSLRASGAQIAWLCVPPGPHVAFMMTAAIAAGMHVIAEKPWLCSQAETELFAASAEKNGIRLAVDFEFCLLAEIEVWRERFHDVPGLRFAGRFAVSHADRLGIPAHVNLGCHLLAIRRYAIPQSEVAELWCGYEAADERRVLIETEDAVIDSVDFVQNRQPIIQRFFRRFEAATMGAEFPFGVDFAWRVAEDLIRWRVPRTAVSLLP